MALRRQVKNVVRNYTDIEVKVREATSNDPWGPSSSLTSEIADATYNNQAFHEIMVLLWKRINDHGKNWRHVYKSLVVLDYIIKTGSERVAQQCKEQIFAIKTLKDFQFIDKDGKDQGVNVREKSKALVALLKDDERLKNERQRALKARERFSQSQGGIGNTSFPKNRRFQGTTKYPESKETQDDLSIPSQVQRDTNDDRNADSRSTDGRIDSELEKVRPSNEAEEELQLQIALAMSREEAEKEERVVSVEKQIISSISDPQPQTSTLLNLTDPTFAAPSTNNADPWLSGGPQVLPKATNDPWAIPPLSQPQSSNPWGASEPASSKPITQPSDPWGNSTLLQQPVVQPPQDPWGQPQPVSQPMVDPFAPQFGSTTINQSTIAPIDNSMKLNTQSLDPMPLFPSSMSTTVDTSNAKKNGNTTFITNGSHLVDIDNIMAKPDENKSSSANPFMTTSNTNPFAQDKPKPKSINELRSDKSNAFAQPGGSGGILLPAPMEPSTTANNPFL